MKLGEERRFACPAGHRASQHECGELQECHYRERRRRKIPCLAFSTIRTTNGSRRTTLGRGFLPECQLSSQQERNLERQSRGSRASRNQIWNYLWQRLN